MKRPIRILALASMVLVFECHCALVRPVRYKSDWSVRNKYSEIKMVVEAIAVVDNLYVETPDWYQISIDTVRNMRKHGVDYIDIHFLDNNIVIGCKDNYQYFDRISVRGEGKYLFADIVNRFYYYCSPLKTEEIAGNYDNIYISSFMESLNKSSYIDVDELKNIVKKFKVGNIGVMLDRKDDGRTVVVSVIPDSPAEKVGIMIGDVVTAIGNELIAGMTIDNVHSYLLGEIGTDVTLWIVRVGQIQSKAFTIKRGKIPQVTHKDMGDGIGYIKLIQFGQYADVELEKALEAQYKIGSRLKGLVLDLRDCPGGLLDQSVKIADMFIDSGLIVSIEGRNKGQNIRYMSTKRKKHINFPIVILVNHGTAAGAEIVTGALHDHKRAVIIGTKTTGNSIIHTIYPLEDGSALRIATAYYYFDKGRLIQDKGILPDIIVLDQEGRSITRSDRGGNDPVLEAGLKVLRLPSSYPVLSQ